MKNLLRRVFGMRLARKIPIMAAGLTLAGIFAVATAAVLVGQNALTDAAKVKLQGGAYERGELVERHLGRIVDDMALMASNNATRQAVFEFAAAWEGMKDPTAELQQDYITENPHPTGEKHKLTKVEKTGGYHYAHGRYHPWYRDMLERGGYYDIFLFDAEGNLIYSVFKELDYATNFKTGPYADSGLGVVFRKAMGAGVDTVVFDDFRPYAPSHGALASFMAAPIFDQNGARIGVIASQMPIDALAAPLQLGLGGTGEAFLVSADGVILTPSRIADTGHTIGAAFDLSHLPKIEPGEVGIGSDIVNGQPYIVGYRPITKAGADWVLVFEQSEAELLAPVADLQQWIAIAALVVTLLAMVTAFLFSRTITRPIKAMGNAIAGLASGDSDGDIPGAERGDELGDMARAMGEIKEAGLKSKRIETALDYAETNMMVADANGDIIFLNGRLRKLLKEHETQIRETLPRFAVDSIVGANFGSFHKNPEHQERLVAALHQPFESRIKFGGLIIDLVAAPIVNAAGVRIGTVTEWRDMTNQTVIEAEIESVVTAAASGDFAHRVSLDGKDGFFRKLAESVNGVMDTAENGLDEVIGVMSDLSAGDLTRRMSGNYEGSFARLAADVNKTASGLADLISQISDASETVGTATGEILQGANNLAARTEEQAATVEKTSVSMDEMTQTVRQNADSAKRANELTAEARSSADNGAVVMNDAVASMQKIESSAAKISEIVVMIDEIAFQTNLLALNAAVEAARAGEAGKGFAVVATEVRSLAQRSSEASKEIKDLIQSSSNQISEGVALVNKTGDTLSGIVSQVNEVAELISEIATASAEQSDGLTEISTAVNKQDESTQQNAALVEETTAAVQSLESQARELNRLVSVFRVSEHAAPMAAAMGGGGGGGYAAPAPARPQPQPATAAHGGGGASPVRAAIARAEAALSQPAGDDDGWEEF